MHARVESTTSDQTGPARFDLPLLRGWFEKADASPHAILDFGVVQPHLVGRMQRFGGKLRVMDIGTSDLKNVQLVDRLQNEIPRHSAQQFDLILTWDFVNFFDSNQIQLLDAVLADTAARNARMHALIYSAKPEMPAKPARFSIRDSFNVTLGTDNGPTIKAPRYSPKFLEKWMTNFKVDRSRLLGNGMQEYLFQRRK